MSPAAIKAWRESRGLTRVQLAVLCSVSPATVANWELGRNAPHGAAAARLMSMIKGEISVMPLTPHEERLLDELVARGGYRTREDFLTSKLLEAIKTTPMPPRLVQYDQGSHHDHPRAAEEAEPRQRWGRKKSAG